MKEELISDISLETEEIFSEEENFFEEQDGYPSEEEESESGGNIYEIFCREISKIPVLTGEEEQEFGRNKKGLEYLTAFPVSYEETEAVFLKSAALRSFFINSNIRLVINVAEKYLDRGLPMLDLIQEGSIGLIKAVDKFDFEMGCKLSTYAVWWIRQSIQKAIAGKTRTIKLPLYISSRIRKYRKIESKLFQVLKREPEPEEVFLAMGMNIEDAKETRSIIFGSLDVVSLNAPLKSDGEKVMFLGDIIPSEEASPEYQLVENGDKEDAEEILEILNPREKEAVKLLCGFYGEDHTLQSTGDKLGVTRERIRQIRERAFKKIRSHIVKKKFKH